MTDKEIKLECERLLQLGEMTNREIANRFDVDEKKVATWKVRLKKKVCSTTKNKDVVQQNKNVVQQRKKIKLKEAEALIQTGSTHKEASQLTGVPMGTLGKWSSANNWINKREKFLEELTDKKKESISQLKSGIIDNLFTIKEDTENATTLEEVIINKEKATVFEKIAKTLGVVTGEQLFDKLAIINMQQVNNNLVIDKNKIIEYLKKANPQEIKEIAMELEVQDELPE